MKSRAAMTTTTAWRGARCISGADVIVANGEEAADSGSTTSGQVFLFDTTGRLTFSGGITGARGQEGDNIGRRRVVTLLAGQKPNREVSSAYGCRLFDSAISVTQ